MAASWEDDDFEAEVKLPPPTKAAWDDEEEEEEEKAPEAPKPPKPAKSKKKEREEKMNAKGRAQEEEPDSSLTPKQREERAAAREMALLGADFGAAPLSLNVDFELSSADWLGDAGKRAMVSSALFATLPTQVAKTDPAWAAFMGELTEKLCLSMASTDVRKLSQKLKDLADQLKKANDEKTKPVAKAGKAKPKLAIGKGGRVANDFDDYGGGGGGPAALDDDDFM